MTRPQAGSAQPVGVLQGGAGAAGIPVCGLGQGQVGQSAVEQVMAVGLAPDRHRLAQLGQGGGGVAALQRQPAQGVQALCGFTVVLAQRVGGGLVLGPQLAFGLVQPALLQPGQAQLPAYRQGGRMQRAVQVQGQFQRRLQRGFRIAGLAAVEFERGQVAADVHQQWVALAQPCQYQVARGHELGDRRTGACGIALQHGQFDHRLGHAGVVAGQVAAQVQGAFEPLPRRDRLAEHAPAVAVLEVEVGRLLPGLGLQMQRRCGQRLHPGHAIARAAEQAQHAAVLAGRVQAQAGRCIGVGLQQAVLGLGLCQGLWIVADAHVQARKHAQQFGVGARLGLEFGLATPRAGRQQFAQGRVAGLPRSAGLVEQAQHQALHRLRAGRFPARLLGLAQGQAQAGQQYQQGQRTQDQAQAVALGVLLQAVADARWPRFDRATVPVPLDVAGDGFHRAIALGRVLGQGLERDPVQVPAQAPGQAPGLGWFQVPGFGQPLHRHRGPRW